METIKNLFDHHFWLKSIEITSKTDYNIYHILMENREKSNFYHYNKHYMK